MQLQSKGSKEQNIGFKTGGYARRILDRGLRASNLFLYPSIFNLLPALVESIAILVLIWRKSCMRVSLTATLVASIFAGVTSAIMTWRLRLLRAQNAAESGVNGVVEDSLSLAETVRAFGAEEEEELRYQHALAQVSRTVLRVRRSFSLLKLTQTLVLGVGAALLVLAVWHSSCSTAASAAAGAAVAPGASIAGTLVLTQSLFAQMSAALAMVGQVWPLRCSRTYYSTECLLHANHLYSYLLTTQHPPSLLVSFSYFLIPPFLPE